MQELRCVCGWILASALEHKTEVIASLNLTCSCPCLKAVVLLECLGRFTRPVVLLAAVIRCIVSGVSLYPFEMSPTGPWPAIAILQGLVMCEILTLKVAANLEQGLTSLSCPQISVLSLKLNLFARD